MDKGREFLRRYDAVLEAVEDLPKEEALTILAGVTAQIERGTAAIRQAGFLDDGRHDEFKGFREEPRHP